MSTITQLRSTADPCITPMVTAVSSANEKTNALSFLCCPLESEKNIGNSIKITAAFFKFLLCWKLMSVCNFKDLLSV